MTIINLVLFFGAPEKVYFLVPSFISAKLYANTVLVVFNNRAQFVTGGQDSVVLHHFKVLTEKLNQYATPGIVFTNCPLYGFKNKHILGIIGDLLTLM